MTKKEKKRILRSMDKESLMLLLYKKQAESASKYTFVQGKNIFESCKSVRPCRKYRNKFSREQAGTCGNYVTAIRVSAYTSVTCKARNNKY